MNKNLSDAVQNSVSQCVKEVINQAKECFKNMSTITSHESTMTMETNSDSTNTDNCQSNANIIQHSIKSSADISTVLSSVLAEEKERSKCQLNLIVHNLEASDNDA